MESCLGRVGRSVLWAATAASAVLLISCQGASPESWADVRFEIPEGVTAPWLAIGADGHGWAYTELHRSDAFIVSNGRRLGPYP